MAITNGNFRFNLLEPELNQKIDFSNPVRVRYNSTDGGNLSVKLILSFSDGTSEGRAIGPIFENVSIDQGDGWWKPNRVHPDVQLYRKYFFRIIREDTGEWIGFNSHVFELVGIGRGIPPTDPASTTIAPPNPTSPALPLLPGTSSGTTTAPIKPATTSQAAKYTGDGNPGGPYAGVPSLERPSSGPSKGTIIGATVGGVLGLIILLAIGGFVLYHKKRVNNRRMSRLAGGGKGKGGKGDFEKSVI